jgi:tetratricopeptide (TPR) repeat protein
MKYFLSALLSFLVISANAQKEDEDGLYTPFAMLMSDIIENVGQERLDAIDQLLVAVENNSTDVDLLSIPSVYFFKARELAYQGKHDEAFDVADKIRKISPTIISNLLSESVSWSYSLGYAADGFVNWIKGDSELAKAYFDSANTYFSDGFYANYYLGWISQNEKNYEKALEYYTKAENGVTVMKYDLADMYYRKGVIYHTMKIYSQAINAYTNSIESYPLCKAFYERGKVYYFSSAFPDKSIAYKDFAGIIENCPDYENLGESYGFVAEEFYYSKKQNYKALEYYKKAYELQGNFTDAGNVSMVYMSLKDWNNVISWATKAINESRNVSKPDARALGDFYFNRGYANWQLQKMDATVNDLLKARSYGHRTADDYLKQYFNK